METVWTLQDAKNRFSELVKAACAGSPQFVQKRGKPAVVVLATEEFERLVQDSKANGKTLGQALLTMPQGDWDVPEDNDTLAMRDVEF